MHRNPMLTLAAAILALAAPLASAQDGGEGLNENWTEINLSVVDRHVIPRYAAFADAGRALSEAAAALCPADGARVERLREAFHGAMDAWQGIQHVQFGPITYFNWNYRLQFWPDDNNTGARQLTALMERADPAVLEPESFARQSVGVQGFPALERLLFDEGAEQALADDGYRCLTARTIAANIGQIAVDVHQRWTDEFRATVANADERGFFESSEDATIDLLKSLIEPFPRIRDQKLGVPLGETPERARVRQAESWRSQRSLRNIALNIDALHDIWGAAGEGVPLHSVFQTADLAAVEEGFTAVHEQFAALPESMVQALESEQGHARVAELKTRVDLLYDALEVALKNTDLYLGFNSLDGD